MDKSVAWSRIRDLYSLGCQVVKKAWLNISYVPQEHTWGCTRIMVYNGHLITATLGSLDFFEIF